MSKRIACALALAWLALPALAQTRPQPDAAPAAAPAAAQQAEEAPALGDVPARIVVSGRRPGPGLWKVSKDGHVMWVFGIYSPLPKDMEWDAGRVERLLGESQAVLLPPSAEAKVGFLKGLALLPQLPRLIGIQENPDGATLHDVLPAEVYAHWTVLRAKYMEVKDSDADRKLERLRPIFVAQRLRRAGLDKNGLSSNGDVREQIIQIAKKNKLKLTSTGFELPLDNVGKAITAFKETRLNDVACFSKTLDSLEQDIGAMRVRANAWANGNTAELQRLDFETLEEACDEAILGSAAAQTNPEFRSMRERLRASWLAAAEKSLAENASTFAILGMKDVFDQKAYLAALQARGYTVESPK
jgi:hypothetical protein